MSGLQMFALTLWFCSLWLAAYRMLKLLRIVRDELHDLSNKLFPIEPIHPGQVARLYYGQLSTP